MVGIPIGLCELRVQWKVNTNPTVHQAGGHGYSLDGYTWYTDNVSRHVTLLRLRTYFGFLIYCFLGGWSGASVLFFCVIPTGRDHRVWEA
eukprot:SAG31_NODE_10183_length_1174_cov_1.049302_2_plen_90_part_00